jgi:hypothetical protein
VRERIREIAQSIGIIHKHVTSPEEWDLLINQCITRISYLACKWPLWKSYMADNIILYDPKVNEALDKFLEVGLRQ